MERLQQTIALPTVARLKTEWPVATLLGFALLLLFVVLANSISPSDSGLRTEPLSDGMARVTWVLPSSDFWEAGIRTGDRVRSLPLPRGSSDLATFEVSSETEVTRTVHVTRPWSPQNYFLLVPLGLEFMVAGLVVYFWSSDRRIASLYLLFSGLSAIALLGSSTLGDSEQPWTVWFSWISVKAASTALAYFFCTVPVRRWRVLVWTLVFANLPFAAASTYFMLVDSSLYGIVQPLGLFYIVICLGTGVVALLWPFFTNAPREHRRFWPVALGGGIGAATFILGSLLPRLFFQTYLIRPEVAILGFALLPVGFIWAILRYRIMGISLGSRALLQTIFETIADPIFVIGRDGYLIDANRSGLALLGIEKVKQAREPFEQMLVRNQTRAGEGCTGAASVIARVLAGEVVRDEEECYCPLNAGQLCMSVTGTTVRDEKGEVSMAVLVYRDITERNSAEQELRESERKYRELADLLPETVFEIDLNGRVTFANRNALKTFGYTPEDLVDGLNARQLVVPGDKQRAEKGVFRLWVGRSIGGREFLAQKKDGSTFPVITHFSTIVHDGSAVGVRGLVVDISEMKRTEQRIREHATQAEALAVALQKELVERREMEAQLLRAQRLEMAGRVAGQVAHDFNNLLGPLVAFPELIKSNLPTGHPAISFCDTMVQSAQQIADINADLLALGRRGHVDHEPTDLNRLVHEALTQMPSLPAALTLRLELVRHLLPVNGSESQLLRILSNLLSNAREAMQDVGILHIKTENLHVDRPFGRYNRVEVGEYVRLEVTDSGCGITEEIKDKIFDPFFTTKRARRRRGSGLGLSVVQAIVDDHHGYIDVTSEIGQGTTFGIYLPVCRTAVEAAPGRQIEQGTESILVVDDEEMQREVSKLLLSTLGYQVDVVDSGEKAVSYLKEHQVDLVMLDMVMPGGIDGAETYRRLIEVCPGQRAIIISGFAESDRVREAQSLGCGAYLRKPVTMDRLARAVREELERKK